MKRLLLLIFFLGCYLPQNNKPEQSKPSQLKPRVEVCINGIVYYDFGIYKGYTPKVVKSPYRIQGEFVQCD